MTNITNHFEYTSKLDKDALRLLLPTEVTPDRISFDVIEVPRDNATDYTAISYTWGDQEAIDHIYLNGLLFPVRPNLWSCLYHLSQYQKTTTVWRYIWVDAICINQSDDTEKSHQVRSMDLTFSKAQCVSVWLGLPKGVTVHAPSSRSHLPPYALDTLSVLELGVDWHEEILDLANRPYWTRIWVIQELVLSTKIHFFCGASNANDETFRKSVSRKRSELLALARPTMGRTRMEADTIMSQTILSQLGRWENKPSYHFSLANLLFIHRKSECRDPRDRVFALLGMANDVAILRDVFPDYTLTHEQVAVITLAHILDSYRFRESPDCLFHGIGLQDASEEYRQDLLKRARQRKESNTGPGAREGVSG